MAIFGILVTVAALNFRPLGNDAHNAAAHLSSGIKQARSRAMATTSAYRVVYAGPNDLRVEYANSCAAATGWTTETRYSLTFEPNVVVQPVGAIVGNTLVCYNSRGLANSNIVFEVSDDRGRSRRVEVYLGGAVEIE